MAVLASDSFDRADAGLGANWTTLVGAGAPAIVSNRVRTGSVGTDSEARYSAITWPDDQYAQVVCMTANGTPDANGPEVRCSTINKTSYICWVLGALGAGAHLVVRKSLNSSHTTLTDTVQTVNSGDVIRIEAQGTSISAYINGVLKSGPTTDSAIASGYAGLIAFADSGSAADSELDTWEAGDFTGAAAVAPQGARIPARPMPTMPGPLGRVAEMRGQMFAKSTEIPDQSVPAPLAGVVLPARPMRTMRGPLGWVAEALKGMYAKSTEIPDQTVAASLAGVVVPARPRTMRGPLGWVSAVQARMRGLSTVIGDVGVTLTPSEAISTWVVGAATLAVGAVTLTPTEATATWTVPTPTLSVGALTLASSSAVSTWTAGTPTLSVGAVTLSPSAAIQTWTVPTATLATGALTLASSPAVATWTVGTPTLALGALTLTTLVATSAWANPTATLSSGIILSPSSAVASWTVGAATLAVGSSVVLDGIPQLQGDVLDRLPSVRVEDRSPRVRVKDRSPDVSVRDRSSVTDVFGRGPSPRVREP
jgi:hypothetical protein